MTPVIKRAKQKRKNRLLGFRLRMLGLISQKHIATRLDRMDSGILRGNVLYK